MNNQSQASGKVLKDALNLNSIYYTGYTTKEKGEDKHESGPFITMLFSIIGLIFVSKKVIQ